MSFPQTTMKTSGRIPEHISPFNILSFSLPPRSPVNPPTTHQNPTQHPPVSQCRNSSISWAPASVLFMKSPHHVDQHRKPQLHIQSQEMQAMGLVLEAIFRPGIKTVRNMAAEQTTKTIYRCPGTTIQENTSITTARKRRAPEPVKRNGIHKTQWTI